MEEVRTSPEVSLLDFELWTKFREVTNEMIVTKSGRRMFPVIRVQLSGLEPSARYSIRLELVQIGTNRYKFHGTEWVASGKGEAASSQYAFRHQDSPNTGAFWMKGPVAFNKAKLTNKPTTDPRYIVLNSLHVYEPRVVIIREGADNFSEIPLSHHAVCTAPVPTILAAGVAKWSFPLRETQFVAVTAYQNERVTQLKVRHNPFAKAFLDSRNGDGQLLGSTGNSFVPMAQQSRQGPQLHLQAHPYHQHQQQHQPQPQHLDYLTQHGQTPLSEPNHEHSHHGHMFHTPPASAVNLGLLERSQPPHNSEPSLSGSTRLAADLCESLSNPLPSTSSEGSSPFYRNTPSSDYWRNEAYRVFPVPSASIARGSVQLEEVGARFVTNQISLGGINSTEVTAVHTESATNTDSIAFPSSPVPQPVPIPFPPSSSFGFPYIHFVENCEPPPPSQDIEQLQ